MTKQQMSPAQALQFATTVLANLAASADRTARPARTSKKLTFEEVFADRHSLGLAARSISRARKDRQNFEFAFLLSEPAWDLFLELFASWAEGRAVCFKDLTVGCSVPHGTAFRYLQLMEDANFLMRIKHSTDGRVVNFELTRKGVVEVGSFLDGASLQLGGPFMLIDHSSMEPFT